MSSSAATKRTQALKGRQAVKMRADLEAAE